MKLRTAFQIWFLFTLISLFEYYALNHFPKFSILFYLQNKFHFFPNTQLITKPGRAISYFLGWLGFGIIVTTNLYIFRKRMSSLHKLGNLHNWMGFHIMCGLIGPTAIVFHSDFKVRGLVAISFWSMMIVAISGIMGSYFYVQVLKQKKQLNNEAQHWERLLKKMRDKTAQHLNDDILETLKSNALKFAGAGMPADDIRIITLPKIFFSSLAGDIKLFMSEPKTHPHLPAQSRTVLAKYAVAVRKIYLIKPFQLLLGYWHTFHVPFSVTMYITAVIHIVVASLFQI